MNGLLAAVPFFSSKPPAPVVRKEYVVNSHNTDGLTGVERYLYIITPEVTGVSTYLDNLKMNQPATAETGVARYLEKTEKKAEAAVIVVRYLDEEERAAKEAKVETIITPDETGVTKYLSSIAGATGVTGYIAEHGLFGGESASSIIRRCLEEEARLAENPVVVPAPESSMTSVERYIDSIPAVTGVSSYLMKKDVPTQEAVAVIVNKCLEAQAISSQNDEITETGVARYIGSKSTKSGVSKYLANQDGSTQKAVDAIIDKCLKAEAISARQKDVESINGASLISRPRSGNGA